MVVGADPRIGSELAGYRIERLLGRGGMSVVYLAEHVRLRRKVALKLLAPDLASDERFRERFLRESRLAASLDHSNIIPIYDADEAEGLLYIAMRYVEGPDLKTLVAREGPLAPRRALSLVAQVASALDVAHERGLIHRDVKPGNVLITEESGAEHVYLADFGLTKEVSSESGLTATGQFVGTGDYMAPEQIERQPVGAAADVYSLGCVLYECLTGEVPYPADRLMAVLWAHVNEKPPSVSARVPDLPAGVDAVVARAMAKAPEERYGSCRELVEAARAELGLSGELGVASPVPPPRTRSRRWLLVAVVALALVAAAAIAAIVATRGGGGETAATKPVLPITVDSLVRIDPATNQVTAAIPVPLGQSGIGSALSIGDGSAWVVNSEDRTLSEIDLQTNRVTRTVDVEQSGTPREVWAAEGAVWVNYGPTSSGRATSGSVERFDPETGSSSVVVSGTYLGGAAGAGAVWVVRALTRSVDRLDPQTLQVVATIPADWDFFAFDENTVWGLGGVAWSRTSGVTRVDPATNEVVARIPLDFRTASGIAAGEGAVWITDKGNDSLKRIDPERNEVVESIRVGRIPSGVAAGAGSVWVANSRDGSISRIDPATSDIVATIEVGGIVDDIAVGEGGVWVTVHAG